MRSQPPNGGPNQFGMPQHPGQQSKKSYAGLVAAALAVVMVCAAAIVALVLALGGDGSENDTTAEKTSQSADSPTPDESTGPPTPDANTVVGTGYSYRLPGGWSDVTADAGSSGKVGVNEAIDSVAAWGSQFQGSRANLIVNVAFAGTATTPQELAKAWRASMQKELGSKPENIAGITVDGQDTIGVRFQRMNENNTEIVQTAYLAINDGKAYTLGMSTTVDQESNAGKALDTIIETWAWN